MDSQKPPTPFVGAGAAAAISGASCASWRGLLEDGIEQCQESALMTGQWANRMKEHLSGADAISYMAVADEVRRRLEARADGRDFASWLKASVGSLEPTKDGWELLTEIHRLGEPSQVIVTTNYDTLLEKQRGHASQPLEWRPFTWKNSKWGSALEYQRAVLHLHGMADNPQSVILSSADYERIAHDKLDKIVSQSIFLRQFLYIGCGDGLSDPHIAPLMQKMSEAMEARRERENEESEDDREHFILVRGCELSRLIGTPPPPGISPVAYGAEFSELTSFLRKLKDKQELDISQNPRDYEPSSRPEPADTTMQPSGRTSNAGRVTVESGSGERQADPPVTPLSRQVLANEQLDEALTAVRRAARAMDQVTDCVALRTGMTTWDPADQLAEHELIAESANEPATRLRDQLREARRAVGRARAAGTAGRIRPGLARAEAQAALAASLKALTAELAEQVTLLYNDLAERGVTSNIRYRPLAQVIQDAQEEAEEARRGASDLRDLPDRRPAQDITEAAATPLAGRRADAGGLARPARPSRPAEVPISPVTVTEMEFVPPTLVASAGPGTDRELLDAEPVPVPPNLAADHNIVVLVEGDSMIGDKIHDGDYLIVDTQQQSISPDEIAVFQKEGSGQPEKFVKRITVGEDVAHYRSANPDYPDGTVADGDSARLIGKVIAVFRPVW
jgi:SOS-response transcriptional repressor LexA